MDKLSMAARQSLATNFTTEVNTDRSVTAPGLAMSPGEALKRYANNTLQRHMDAFYSLQAIEMPDLGKMSKLERLQLQAKYREDLQAAQKSHQKAVETAQAKAEAMKAAKAEKSTETTPEASKPTPGA